MGKSRSERHDETNEFPQDPREEALMDQACTEAGMSDFGEPDVRGPLRAVLASHRMDARLSETGERILHNNMVRNLVNRLRVRDELKRRPEIERETIRRPLFIISLHRTGTTLLHKLLSMDPANRTPLLWEMHHPAPPPAPGDRETDPRIARLEESLKLLHAIAPGLSIKHPFEARGPEECRFILDQTLTSPSFVTNAHLPAYREWLDGQDMTPAYRYHRKVLQIFQSALPTERWVLKTPYHLYALNALMAVYPDARVVQTHRDPRELVPSFCSLMTEIRRLSSDHVDDAVVSREILDLLKTWTDRFMAARDGMDPDRFFDIRYDDLVRDPVGAVRSLYDAFGYDFDARLEGRMNEWLAGNPKDKHGAHRYTLEQFGLDGKMVDRAFETYRSRFDIRTS